MGIEIIENFENGKLLGRMQLYRNILESIPKKVSNKKEADRINDFFRIWFGVEWNIYEKYPELKQVAEDYWNEENNKQLTQEAMIQEYKSITEKYDLEKDELFIFWAMLQEKNHNFILLRKLAEQFSSDIECHMSTKEVGKIFRNTNQTRNIIKRPEGVGVCFYPENFQRQAMELGMIDTDGKVIEAFEQLAKELVYKRDNRKELNL